MSQLEAAILALVEVFIKYAGEDDDKKKLNAEELKALLTAELSNPEFKGKLDPEDIDDALKIMDKNRDEQVSFREFNKCVSRLACHYYRKKYGKDKEKGKGKNRD